MADTLKAVKRAIFRLRFRVGCWIVGHDFEGAFALLWIIRDRAQQAVTPDGRVVLARCEPLAEALYTKIPGNWSMTFARSVAANPPGRADVRE